MLNFRVASDDQAYLRHTLRVAPTHPLFHWAPCVPDAFCCGGRMLLKPVTRQRLLLRGAARFILPFGVARDPQQCEVGPGFSTVSGMRSALDTVVACGSRAWNSQGSLLEPIIMGVPEIIIAPAIVGTAAEILDLAIFSPPMLLQGRPVPPIACVVGAFEGVVPPI